MNPFASQFAVVAAALADDPRDAARLARPAGFAGLQFDARSAALDITGLSVSGRRDFLHVVSSHNRQLVGLRADLGPAGMGPGADIDRLIHQLDGVMEAAAGLAAPLVCLDMGPLPQPPPEPYTRPAISPDQAGLLILPPSMLASPDPPPAPAAPSARDVAFAAQVDSAMAEIGRCADRYGVTVACRSELAGFAALATLLHRASCPWLGVDLDPVAILRDDWPVDEVLSRLGHLIRHVRARDARKGAGHRTQPAIIGQGSVEWPRLLADLDAASYHGWITIDPVELTDRRAAAQAGLEVLHRLRRA